MADTQYRRIAHHPVFHGHIGVSRTAFDDPDETCSGAYSERSLAWVSGAFDDVSRDWSRRVAYWSMRNLDAERGALIVLKDRYWMRLLGHMCKGVTLTYRIVGLIGVTLALHPGGLQAGQACDGLGVTLVAILWSGMLPTLLFFGQR